MVEVIWTANALADLDDIGVLERNLKAGKIVPELNNEFIRHLIRGSYRIIYHIVNENRIDILTVHRTSRLVGNTYDFGEWVNE